MRKFIGICLFFLLVSSLFIQFYGTPWGILQAKKESVHYLESKYGEALHVKLPKVWIMDRTFHAEVSPAARPDLIFSVGTEQGEEGIQDNYFWESWRYEAAREVKALVAPYYKAKNVFVELHNPSPPLHNADLYAYEKYNELDIIIDLQKLSLASKEEENAKIYQILMEMIQQEIPLKNFGVLYANEQFHISKTELLQLRNEADLFTYWITI